VEFILRSTKSLLETRPIYHKCEDTIRGHVLCSFLALLLRKRLQDLMEESEESADEETPEWVDIIRALDTLAEMEVQVNEKRYTIRSEPRASLPKSSGPARWHCRPYCAPRPRHSPVEGFGKRKKCGTTLPRTSIIHLKLRTCNFEL